MFKLKRKLKNESVDTLTTPKARRKLLVPALAVLLVLAIGTAGFMTYKYQNAKKNPQSLIQADQQKLIDKVGQLITLPNDEQPSIATVSDKSKLGSQAFFNNSQNGDTLLIYTKARKAVLYRESQNKVIEVAPIAIDTSTSGTATNTTTTETKKDK